MSAVGLASPLPTISGAVAVNGLEDRAVLAEIRAGHDAEAAHQSGSQVRDDVAIKVRQHQQVKRFRPHHELHTAVVDDQLVVGDIGILGGGLAAALQEQTSLIFMMLALWTAVTFFRPSLRA